MAADFTQAGALGSVWRRLAAIDSGAKKKAVPLSWNGLLAKSSGEEGKLCLHRRRSRVRARLLRSCARSVRHQAHIHAAVGCAAFAGLVFFDRLVLAQPDHVNLVGWNVVFRAEVLNHRASAAFTQTVVVVRWTDRVGSTFHGDDVTLGVGHCLSQLVEVFFGLFGQEVLVKAEVYGGLSNNLVVI